MSSVLEKYQRMKKKLDRFDRTREQKVGALNQIIERLQKEHGCDDLEAARKKRKAIKAEREQKEQELAVTFKAFERKYRHLFEAVPSEPVDSD